MKKAITKSTNWLTAGLSEEEILAKKTLAVIEADIELRRIGAEKQIPKRIDNYCPNCGAKMGGRSDA